MIQAPDDKTPTDASTNSQSIPRNDRSSIGSTKGIDNSLGGTSRGRTDQASYHYHELFDAISSTKKSHSTSVTSSTTANTDESNKNSIPVRSPPKIWSDLSTSRSSPSHHSSFHPLGAKRETDSKHSNENIQCSSMLQHQLCVKSIDDRADKCLQKGLGLSTNLHDRQRTYLEMPRPCSMVSMNSDGDYDNLKPVGLRTEPIDTFRNGRSEYENPLGNNERSHEAESKEFDMGTNFKLIGSNCMVDRISSSRLHSPCTSSPNINLDASLSALFDIDEALFVDNNSNSEDILIKKIHEIEETLSTLKIPKFPEALDLTCEEHRKMENGFLSDPGDEREDTNQSCANTQHSPLHQEENKLNGRPNDKMETSQQSQMINPVPPQGYLCIDPQDPLQTWSYKPRNKLLRKKVKKRGAKLNSSSSSLNQVEDSLSSKKSANPTKYNTFKFPVHQHRSKHKSKVTPICHDASTVDDLISTLSPQLTLRPIVPLTVHNLQRLSSYDNYGHSHGSAIHSKRTAASSKATNYCQPWDSSGWQNLMTGSRPPQNRRPSKKEMRRKWEEGRLVRGSARSESTICPHSPSESGCESASEYHRQRPLSASIGSESDDSYCLEINISPPCVHDELEPSDYENDEIQSQTVIHMNGHQVWTPSPHQRSRCKCAMLKSLH